MWFTVNRISIPQCAVSSLCGFFLHLSTSCPPLLLSSSLCNKQHEGGYNWEVQSSARWNHLYLNTGSHSLSRSLLYIVSLPLFLLLYTLFSSLSVLHGLSHYAHSSVCIINMIRQSFATILSFYFWKRFYTAFLFTNCFSSVSHPLSIQYNTTLGPRCQPPPPVLKGTCQALPLKGVHLIYRLPPSLSFLSSCLLSFIQDREDSVFL